MVYKVNAFEILGVFLLALYIVGLGLADKTKGENCLYNLFKVWEKYL
jgi:hypothetical protein